MKFEFNHKSDAGSAEIPDRSVERIVKLYPYGTIAIERRPNEYWAYFESDRKKWAAGRTAAEAMEYLSNLYPNEMEALNISKTGDL